MKRMKAGWVAISVLGISLMTVHAQTGVRSSSVNPLSQAERAANLYGREVLSLDNQKVGRIDNVVVDLESEHILYVVLGTDRGKVAVPPQVIGQTAGNTLRANLNKAKIDSAPQFSSALDKPNQLGQASFVFRVYQYFGMNPWWQGNSPANVGSFHNVHKLNQLIGMNVEDVN